MPFGVNALRLYEPLSQHTSFGIGGPARFWYEPVTDELDACHELATRAGMPMLVIGDGTNCLVSDAGFDGMVCKLSDAARLTSATIDATSATVSVRASHQWDDFVNWCCRNNLQGVECMAGIPGTVGGAVFGSIGAYGQSVADTIEWVDTLNIWTGERSRFSRTHCAFTYRHSIFHSALDIVILEVGFRLHYAWQSSQSNQPAWMTHPDIAQRLPFTASLCNVAAAVRRIRERKGALLWLIHRGQNRTAGSFFKNPTVGERRFDQLTELLDLRDPRTWWWPVGDEYRISAARLIEVAGFMLGHRIGDAAIAPEHTLSLVNMGSATAADIINLARRIQDRVHAVTNIVLQPEVRFIGFQRPPLG